MVNSSRNNLFSLSLYKNRLNLIWGVYSKFKKNRTDGLNKLKCSPTVRQSNLLEVEFDLVIGGGIYFSPNWPKTRNFSCFSRFPRFFDGGKWNMMENETANIICRVALRNLIYLLSLEVKRISRYGIKRNTSRNWLKNFF